MSINSLLNKDQDEITRKPLPAFTLYAVDGVTRYANVPGDFTQRLSDERHDAVARLLDLPLQPPRPGDDCWSYPPNLIGVSRRTHIPDGPFAGDPLVTMLVDFTSGLPMLLQLSIEMREGSQPVLVQAPQLERPPLGPFDADPYVIVTKYNADEKRRTQFADCTQQLVERDRTTHDVIMRAIHACPYATQITKAASYGPDIWRYRIRLEGKAMDILLQLKPREPNVVLDAQREGDKVLPFSEVSPDVPLVDEVRRGDGDPWHALTN